MNQNENLNSVLESYKARTENRGPEEGADHEVYKVWPTNADRKEFEDLMTAGCLENVEKTIAQTDGKATKKTMNRKPMAMAYVYFYRQMDEFCSEVEAESSFSRRECLEALNHLFRYVFTVVDISLEHDDDEQVIFETLNDRGEPLLASDLVRNFVLTRAETMVGRKMEDLYEKYWKEYDMRDVAIDGNRIEHGENNERFWMQEDRHGRAKRRRIDLFLFHYLQSKKPGEELSIQHLYKIFQEWWVNSDCDNDIDKVLRDMNEHSSVYAILADPVIGGRLEKLAENLKTLDTTTVFPVLLFLLAGHKDRVAESDLIGIYEDIESFLVRRYVCGLSQKGYNKLFVGLLRKLNQVDELRRSVVQDHLLEGTGDAVVWPKDALFYRAWISRSIYQPRNSQRVRMVLAAINGQMYTDRSDTMPTKALTVEHIMPVKWKGTAGWPLNMGEDYKKMCAEGENVEEMRDRLIHTFGNLTLLVSKSNESVGNADFSRKRGEIENHSRIPLNDFAKKEETWTELQIQKRGDSLFQLAKKIWPRPE